MADNRVLSELANLLRHAREASGLTQHDLAKSTSRERSWIAGVESGSRHPQLQAALDLGRALKLPDPAVSDAWYHDHLQGRAPGVLEQIARRSDGTVSAWDRMARDRICVSDGVVTRHIDDEGTLETDRDYRNCTTPRPCRRLVIREQIQGADPGRIDVIEAPEYQVTSRTHNKMWREHEIAYTKPWQPSDSPIHIGVRARAVRAYLLATGPKWEQRQVDGGPHPAIGVVGYGLRYAFERLRMPIAISERHRIRWLEPLATTDDKLLADDDTLPVAEIAARAEWTTNDNRAELKLERPLPAYRIYLRWASILDEE